MQTMADVMGVSIKVLDSGQACALGAAMFASVIADYYPDMTTAQNNMKPGYSAVFEPDSQHHEIYNKLYYRYLLISRRAR